MSKLTQYSFVSLELLEGIQKGAFQEQSPIEPIILLLGFFGPYIEEIVRIGGKLYKTVPALCLSICLPSPSSHLRE